MVHLVIAFLLYFLPAIIGRHKHDAMGIFIVNLLFGWTVIGWIIALIWACTAEPAHPMRYVAVPVGARFCCNCGTGIYPGAHFCTSCGRTL
jgi:hypothetical protein